MRAQELPASPPQQRPYLGNPEGDMISGGGLMRGLPRERVLVDGPRKNASSPFEPNPAGPSITDFHAMDYDDNGAETGFVFIPPDPSGAAGTDRVIAVANVMIEARTKAGALLWKDALKDFFSPLTPTTFTFDPKVVYDHYEGRFVVVTLEQEEPPVPANPSAGNISRILLAVSKTGTPATATAADWYYHAIDAKTPIDAGPPFGVLEFWADYPGFELDEEAVYITANMFAFPPFSGFGGVRLWIVDKGVVGGFYSGGAAAVTVHNPYALAGIATTTMPALVFGVGGVPGGPPVIGTFLVSYSGLTGGGIEFVQIVRVDDPLGTPSFTQEYVSVGDIEGPSFPALPDAPQSGSSAEIEVNDRRALDAVWRDGELWLTTTILPNSGSDVGQTTAHWFELSTTAVPGGAITLSDQGDVGGEDIATGTFTFFPSIAVNSSGTAGIGFSASAPSIFPGAYATGRHSTDSAGTTQGSATLKAGEDFYLRTFGGPRNRWGDYSGMAIDPVDGSFWVYNEYAMLRGSGTPPEDGKWGTRWGNFSDASLPIQISYFNGAGTTQGDVSLEWGPVSETNNYGFEIEKSPNEPTSYQLIPNSFVPGHGTTLEPQQYSYTDTTATAGQWWYRLKQIDLDGTVHYMDGIAVDILTSVSGQSLPIAYSLGQNYPNPFNPTTLIQYSLPASGHVSLSIYNLLGRKVATLVNSRQESGSYESEWDATGVSSGIYFYRIQAGDYIDMKKLVLMK
jgi:hypothetical protein